VGGEGKKKKKSLWRYIVGKKGKGKKNRKVRNLEGIAELVVTIAHSHQGEEKFRTESIYLAVFQEREGRGGNRGKRTQRERGWGL